MGKPGGKFFKFSLIIGGIVFLTLAVIILTLAIESATLDQRIAQFEAKRKIPDSENAALIYDRLFTDVNFTSIFDDNIFTQMSTKEFYKVYRKPWKSQDYPETAEWINSQKDAIIELLKASKFEKCYFPLPTNMNEYSLHLDKFRMFRETAKLMVYSANNDVSEGRIDNAIEKYQFTCQMAEHLYQQPLFIDYFNGIVVDSLSVDYLKELIFKTEISEDQLRTIDKFPVQINNIWKQQISQLLEGERLFLNKIYGTSPFYYNLYRIYLRFPSEKNSLKVTHDSYLRLLCYRRGNRILLGLRHFKNNNGNWPESLEQIKPLIDPNALVDPWNNGSFVYKLTDDGFTLYSRGPNNIDEGSKFESDKQGNLIADDWPIWPEKR